MNQLKKTGMGREWWGLNLHHAIRSTGAVGKRPSRTPGMEEKEHLELCTTWVLGALFHLYKMSFSRCKSRKTRGLWSPSSGCVHWHAKLNT